MCVCVCLCLFSLRSYFYLILILLLLSLFFFFFACLQWLGLVLLFCWSFARSPPAAYFLPRPSRRCTPRLRRSEFLASSLTTCTFSLFFVRANSMFFFFLLGSKASLDHSPLSIGCIGAGDVLSGVKTAFGSEQLNFLNTFTALRMACRLPNLKKKKTVSTNDFSVLVKVALL